MTALGIEDLRIPLLLVSGESNLVELFIRFRTFRMDCGVGALDDGRLVFLGVLRSTLGVCKSRKADAPCTFILDLKKKIQTIQIKHLSDHQNMNLFFASLLGTSLPDRGQTAGVKADTGVLPRRHVDVRVHNWLGFPVTDFTCSISEH